METKIVSELRRLPVVRVRRERRLPVPGELMVTVGARVDGLDVIARAVGIKDLRPIPLARYMHLKEAALEKHLLKHPGAHVQEREVIATKPEYLGTFQRIYRAPKEGRVASLQGTWITLDLSDTPFQVQALYRGTVVGVTPRLGVTIEAIGALVQCAWGAGEGYGVLKKMVESPSELLTEEMIDVSLRGTVLLAGMGASDAALERAADERVGGVIVGSLRAGQMERALARGLPILLTEGFGERAMDSSSFQLLASHAAQEVALSAGQPPHQQRPEVFIPAKGTSGRATETPAADPLRPHVGASVRVIAPPQWRERGKIVEVLDKPQLLESGITAWGALIELNSGEHVFTPWENLELVD